MNWQRLHREAGPFIGVIKEIDLRQIWKISNLLSISRVFLIIPVCYFLLRDQDFDNYYALGLMVVASLTDFLDGYLARKLNQVTELGKILDPISDKICLLAVALCLSAPSRDFRFPYTLLLTAFLRDLTVVVGGYWAFRARDVIMVSNWWGKWTSAIFALLTITITLEIPKQPWYLFWLDHDILIWVTFTLLIASSLSYFIRFLDVVSGTPPETKSNDPA